MSTTKKVLCYRYRGYEQDGDGGVKRRPDVVEYKFCYIEDLTNEQMEYLERWNGITLGNFFVGGCGDEGPPSDVLKFLTHSPVWFGLSIGRKIVPPECVVVQNFYMDLIDS